MKSIYELESSWVNRGSLVPLLPLLEYDYEEAQQEVSKSQVLSDDIIQDLVKFSLSYSSNGYWAMLSIGWMEKGFPINEEIYKVLSDIAKDRNKAQDFRNKALAQAIRYKKSLSTC